METKHNLRKALLVADGGSTKTDWCLAVPHREPQLSVRVDSTQPCWNLPPSGKSCKRNCFPGWPPISKDRKRKPISIITVRDACLPSATRWDRPLPDSSPAPQPKSIPTCWGLHGPYADTKPALPAFWAPVPIPAVTTDRTLCNMCLRWDTS